MKLYVLRHEKRGSDASFYSPLLKEGLDNSEKLVKYLDNEKIDLIFSSPFKRTLQTVKPYCDKKNLKINVEFSLYEKMHKNFFNKNTNYNILLVSHATTVNSILYDSEKKYRMGLLTKFYDNDKFVNIPIN